MEITLANGRRVEIKKIDISGGQVDYRRLDDPIYGGDLVLYHPFLNEETVDAEILAALNASEAEREAAQTAADAAKEVARLAEIARLAAKAQSIATNLPSWAAVEAAINVVSTDVTNAATLAAVKPPLLALIAIVKKLARVQYWMAKGTAA